jgi:hypothetical protein
MVISDSSEIASKFTFTPFSFLKREKTHTKQYAHHHLTLNLHI